MASAWAAVDDLMRELGSVRQAAISMQAAGAIATAAIDRAIGEAADAVGRAIDDPQSPARLMAARDALGVAEEVIIALDAEIGRSLRIRKRAETLRARAAELIRQAGDPRPLSSK
jgi:hypothetical protein